MLNKPPRLELDYLKPRRRTRWASALVLVLSLALAVGLVSRYRDLQLELARLEAYAPVQPKEVPQERLSEEIRNAEAVVRQLGLPWASLVRAVEQAATRDVALLQLQPDAETRLVRLTAETRDPEAMFDYVRRLGAAKGMTEVHLISHEVQRDDPRRPIHFSAQARLR
jgi:hypothetical protein